jgi:hypothetical protein
MQGTALHAGDRIYDGIVREIRLNEVVFEQHLHDAFGRPVTRTVAKPVSGSIGENP